MATDKTIFRVLRIEENICLGTNRIHWCAGVIKTGKGHRECQRPPLRVFHKAYIEGDWETYLCPAHQRAFVRNRKMHIFLRDKPVELRLTDDAIVE